MYIIAGLGNPGAKYDKTRHNMGFHVIDILAERYGISVNKSQFKALTGQGIIRGKKVLLVKPQTFMNLSGQSISQVMNFYKADHQDLMVVYDDLDLPLGKDFPRLRLGIGAPEKSSMVNFVIGKVPKEEQIQLNQAASLGADAVEDYIESGIDLAMNRNNTKRDKSE